MIAEALGAMRVGLGYDIMSSLCGVGVCVRVCMNIS